MCKFNCILKLAVKVLYSPYSAPYLASQPLDSSLLTQPCSSYSSSQSSTQLSSSTSSQQLSGNAVGSSVPNSSSNSGSANSSSSSSSLVTPSGQPVSGMPSAKPTSFPNFGTMNTQGQGSAPQSGQLVQQAGTQNAGSSGESSSNQVQGPSEPPERY